MARYPRYRDDVGDLDAKDRGRSNSAVQSVLVKESFRPAGLVARIRRLVGGRNVAEVAS
jgi:hypothetical protein